MILGPALMRALPMKNLNSAELGIATGAIVARTFFLSSFRRLRTTGVRRDTRTNR